MKIAKALILGFTIFGISQSAICQNKANKEKIKSIIVLEEKSNTLIKKQYKDSETYFDAKGNVIEEINYKQGKMVKHFKYQYDGDNNKIKEEEYDASGNIIETSEYKFENGLRIEKIVYDADKKIKLKKTYQYTMY